MRDLLNGLDGIVRQIDEVLRAVGDGVGAKAGEASEELTSTLRATRARLEDVERDLQRNVGRLARSTDRYVQEHPWFSIAVAASAAFALGALLASALASARRSERAEAQPSAERGMPLD